MGVTLVVFHPLMLVNNMGVFVAMTTMFAMNPNDSFSRRSGYVGGVLALRANGIKFPMRVGHTVVISFVCGLTVARRFKR